MLHACTIERGVPRAMGEGETPRARRSVIAANLPRWIGPKRPLPEGTWATAQVAHNSGYCASEAVIRGTVQRRGVTPTTAQVMR